MPPEAPATSTTNLGGPVPSGPDEDLLGKANRYPLGTEQNWLSDENVRVGTFSGMDQVFPHNVLPKSDSCMPLSRGSLPPGFAYFHAGQRRSIEDYLSRQRVMGLLVIQGGEILYEQYQYDRNARHRFVSHSIAKSLVSLAVGLALQERSIVSLDDSLESYVVELQGTAYGQTSVRQLLRMSSGVRFTESFNGKDDLARFLYVMHSEGEIAALRLYHEREAAPGMCFRYSTAESIALGVLVRTVTGTSLSAYLAKKLWAPLGAEADATWAKGPTGAERIEAGFNAVLRDYGRLGALLAHDGVLQKKQILPRSYVVEATDWRSHPDAFAPGAAGSRLGYGYQFWILPGRERRFAMIGAYGQAVFVDPTLRLVMVQAAAAKNALFLRDSMGVELFCLWNALVARCA